MDPSSVFKEWNYKVVEAKRVVVSNIWSNFVNYYPHNRLYLINSGQSVLTLKEREITLTPGNLYFIPAHSIITARDTSLLDHYFLHFESSNNFNNLLHYYHMDFSLPALPEDYRLFQLVTEFMYIGTIAADLKVDGAFRLLMSRFFDSAILRDPTIFRFEPALRYIDEHMHTQITNAQLAKQLCLNTKYFVNLFTHTFGVSPMQFVIQKKLNCAMGMLVEDAFTVKQIAEQLGFESEVYFSRLFKQKCFQSPSQYRKNALQKFKDEKQLSPLFADSDKK